MVEQRVHAVVVAAISDSDTIVLIGVCELDKRYIFDENKAGITKYLRSVQLKKLFLIRFLDF